VKKVFKSIIVVLVIASSMFFMAGQSLDYFVFKYRQTVIRKEIKTQIKNGVEKSELYVFSYDEIQLGNVEWIKPGKEFKKNGKMYDVVHIVIKGGKWFYQCVDDVQEAKLFKELDHLVQNRMNNESSDDYLKNLIKDFVKVYFESEKTVFISYQMKENTIFHFSFPNCTFEIPSPPPQKFV